MVRFKRNLAQPVTPQLRCRMQAFQLPGLCRLSGPGLYGFRFGVLSLGLLLKGIGLRLWPRTSVVVVMLLPLTTMTR